MLFFDIKRTHRLKNLVLEEFTKALAWDETRVDAEKKSLEYAIRMATTFKNDI